MFEQLKDRLAQIEELQIDANTFILAAEFYNTCRAAGITAGGFDMTICAAAHLHATPIFTTDPDFIHYAKYLPIGLHKY
jgi:predicted nucleic acid-binding protein